MSALPLSLMLLISSSNSEKLMMLRSFGSFRSGKGVALILVGILSFLSARNVSRLKEGGLKLLSAIEFESIEREARLLLRSSRRRLRVSFCLSRSLWMMFSASAASFWNFYIAESAWALSLALSLVMCGANLFVVDWGGGTLGSSARISTVLLRLFIASPRFVVDRAVLFRAEPWHSEDLRRWSVLTLVSACIMWFITVGFWKSI